jgi:hypothetical protein
MGKVRVYAKDTKCERKERITKSEREITANHKIK